MVLKAGNDVSCAGVLGPAKDPRWAKGYRTVLSAGEYLNCKQQKVTTK